MTIDTCPHCGAHTLTAHCDSPTCPWRKCTLCRSTITRYGHECGLHPCKQREHQ